jgi:hypothetical protein
MGALPKMAQILMLQFTPKKTGLRNLATFLQVLLTETMGSLFLFSICVHIHVKHIFCWPKVHYRKWVAMPEMV